MWKIQVSIKKEVEFPKDGWGELRTWNFQGYYESKCGKSRCQLKKKWNFPGYSRKTDAGCGIPMDLGFLIWAWNFQQGVSHNFAQNFQGWKLVFSRTSKGKFINLKFPGVFQKSMSSIPPFWFFFWNSPILHKREFC